MLQPLFLSLFAETRGAMTPQQPTDDRKPTSEGVANNQAVFPCRMEATTSQQEFVTVPGPEDRSRQSDSRGSNGDAAVATIDSPMIFPCRHIDATGQNPFVASSRGSIFNPLLHQSYFTTTTNPLMPPSSSNPLNMPTAVPVCPMTAPSPLPGTAALTMQTVVTSANAVNIPQPVTTAVAMAMPPPASNPPRKHSRGGGGGGGGGGGANNNNGNAATPPIERRHPCRECGKRFKQMSHLKVHQRQRHSSERPYACDVCEKRFARGCDLNRHSRSHSRAPMHHFVSQVDPTAAAM